MKKIEDYILTSSVTECVEGLRFILNQLEGTLENPYNWKWIILALDNTVQNFMVYTLRDSAGVNILRKKIRAPYYKSLRENTPRPKELLDEFLSIYEATKGQEMKQYVDSKSYVPINDEEKNIKRLHSIRNEFIHFIPKSWLLYVTGMPQVVLDCMKYINFLAFESFNFLIVYKKDEIMMKSLIRKINIVSQQIKVEYDLILKAHTEKNEKQKRKRVVKIIFKNK